MIYQNIAKIQMCKHLQNHLFIFSPFTIVQNMQKKEKTKE